MGSIQTRPTDAITEVNLLAGLPFVEFFPSLTAGGFGAGLNLGILDTAALEKSTTLQQLKSFGSGSGKLVRELVGELEATLKVGVFNWEAALFRYAIASGTITDLNSGSQTETDEQFVLNGPGDPDGDIFIDLKNRSLNGGFGSEMTSLSCAAIADEVVAASTDGTLGDGSGDYALDFKPLIVGNVTEVKTTDLTTGAIVTYTVIAVGAKASGNEVEVVVGVGATSGDLQFAVSGSFANVPTNQKIEATYEPTHTFTENTHYIVDGARGAVRVEVSAANGNKVMQPMECTYNYAGFTGKRMTPFTQTVFQGKAILRHLPDVGVNFIWTIPKCSLRITDDELAFSKDGFAVLPIAIQLLDDGTSEGFGYIDFYDEDAA